VVLTMPITIAWLRLRCFGRDRSFLVGLASSLLGTPFRSRHASRQLPTKPVAAPAFFGVPLLLLGIGLFGLGLGNATSLPPLIVQQDLAPADTARAVALVTACSQACYAFAPAAFGVLRDLGTEATASGGGHRLFIAAALGQFAAASVMFLNRQRAERPAVIEV